MPPGLRSRGHKKNFRSSFRRAQLRLFFPNRLEVYLGTDWSKHMEIYKTQEKVTLRPLILIVGANHTKRNLFEISKLSSSRTPSLPSLQIILCGTRFGYSLILWILSSIKIILQSVVYIKDQCVDFVNHPYLKKLPIQTSSYSSRFRDNVKLFVYIYPTISVFYKIQWDHNSKMMLFQKSIIFTNIYHCSTITIWHGI